MTIWKTIPGFSQYAVSDKGQVKRLACPYRKRGKRVLPEKLLTVFSDGKYLKVSLSRDSDGKFKGKRVHTLVALAFHGPHPKNKPWALHKNDIKTENTPNNIYWGAPHHNSADAKANGISCVPKKFRRASVGHRISNPK